MVDAVLAALARAQAAGTELAFVVVLPGSTAQEARAAGKSAARSAEALDQLLESPFLQAATPKHVWPFRYGLAFKTDAPWPPLQASARLVVLQSLPARPRAGPAEPGLLRSALRAWGGGGAGEADA
ncbi:unnamed protein product [Prorocentrum cordatum]|uniref:Uncharacterized protein n=1 Tax=Prorocentrum cordatum TaxID=2364126 RepID=A0ABN9S2E8_9DINO|nr:unnamed protein product [Polarella glacialis]